MIDAPMRAAMQVLHPSGLPRFSRLSVALRRSGHVPHGVVAIPPELFGHLLPLFIESAPGVIFNGVPPYSLWEHPPAIGRIPPHRTDAGSLLLAECFSCRSLTLVKDVDGLYDRDPKRHAGASLIREIDAAELKLRRMETLPFERVLLEELEEPLPFAHDADSLAAVHVWNLSTRYGDLDLSFVPAGTSGYDDLARDATEMPLYGVTVTVASLADVIRSKQAANRPKDQRVLPTLREILASRHSDTSRRRPQGGQD